MLPTISTIFPYISIEVTGHSGREEVREKVAECSHIVCVLERRKQVFYTGLGELCSFFLIHTSLFK